MLNSDVKKKFNNGIVIKEQRWGGQGIWGGVYLAQDSDFSGTGVSGDRFKYIGTELELEIPRIIKGVVVDTYFTMFASTNNIKKVVSNNENINNMGIMFSGLKTTSLDLSEFANSNVTNMAEMFRIAEISSILDLRCLKGTNVTNTNLMFRDAKIPTIDLSMFDSSKLIYKSNMFAGCTATTVYVKSLGDLTRLSTDTGAPSAMNFVVK